MCHKNTHRRSEETDIFFHEKYISSHNELANGYACTCARTLYSVQSTDIMVSSFKIASQEKTKDSGDKKNYSPKMSSPHFDKFTQYLSLIEKVRKFSDSQRLILRSATPFGVVGKAREK